MSPTLSKNTVWSQEGKTRRKDHSLVKYSLKLQQKHKAEASREPPLHSHTRSFFFFTTFQPEYRQGEIYNVPFHLTHNLTLRPLWVLKWSRYFCSWKKTLNWFKIGRDGFISHILKCHRQKESHDGFLEAAMSSFWSSLENVKSSSVQHFFLKAQLLQQLNLNMESTHQLHLLLINGGFGSSSADSYLKWCRELLMARECFWWNNDRMLSDCDQKGWKHLNTVGRRLKKVTSKLEIQLRC